LRGLGLGGRFESLDQNFRFLGWGGRLRGFVIVVVFIIVVNVSLARVCVPD
jgi:hypothetical protein